MEEKTVKDVKQKLIDYLYDVKLDALNISDLYTYSQAVRVADEMEKPDYMEAMTSMLSSGYGFGGAKKESEGN